MIAIGEEQITMDDAQAQFTRGRDLIRSGEQKQGLEWVRRAATNGLLRAQGTLAEMLLDQKADAPRTEALRWALLAARQGDPIMQKRLTAELRPGDPEVYFRE